MGIYKIRRTLRKKERNSLLTKKRSKIQSKKHASDQEKKKQDLTVLHCPTDRPTIMMAYREVTLPKIHTYITVNKNFFGIDLRSIIRIRGVIQRKVRGRATFKGGMGNNKKKSCFG